MTPDQIAEAEKLVKEWKPGSCKTKKRRNLSSGHLQARYPSLHRRIRPAYLRSL